jgi:hypothetical protein
MEGKGGRLAVGVGAWERMSCPRCGFVCCGFSLLAVFLFVDQDRMGNLEDSCLNCLLEVMFDGDVLRRYDLPI